ncbi:hypothetical protein BLNAU_6539 [Blattamonas nauphoetae]|uniref:Uncharacterized protein n=1 Tax=Blattamonas nauphoetae TaxID=2049346 RepID=A0ABQ9Y471_9EUKA|nr:hypothetical protein BLNAU_6539 [Blattamonas nauphoetae]
MSLRARPDKSCLELERRIEVLDGQYEKERIKFEQKLEENQHLSEELFRIQQSLEEADEEYDNAYTTRKSLETERDRNETTIKKLEAKLIVRIDEKGDGDKIQKLFEKVQELKAERKELRRQYEQIQDELDARTTIVTAIRIAVRISPEQYEASTDDELLDKIQLEFDDVVHNGFEMQNQQGIMTQKLISVKRKLAHEKKGLIDETKECERLNRKLDTLKEQYNQSVEEHNELSQNLADLVSQNSESRDQMRALATTNFQLKREKEEYERSSRQEMESLIDEIESLQSEIKHSSEQITRLEDTTYEFEKETHKLIDDGRSLKSRFEQQDFYLQTEKTEHESKMKVIEAEFLEVDELNQVLNAKKDQLTKSIKEKDDDFLMKNEEFTAASEALSQELEKTQRLKSELEEEILQKDHEVKDIMNALSEIESIRLENEGRRKQEFERSTVAQQRQETTQAEFDSLNRQIEEIKESKTLLQKTMLERIAIVKETISNQLVKKKELREELEAALDEIDSLKETLQNHRQLALTNKH